MFFAGNPDFFLFGSGSQILHIFLVEVFLIADPFLQTFDFFVKILNLAIQLSNILIDEVILLFIFQESRSDLFDVINAAFFFDIFKTLPNGFHGLFVALNDLDPFPISCDEMSQAIPNKREIVDTLIFWFYFNSPLEQLIGSFATV